VAGGERLAASHSTSSASSAGPTPRRAAPSPPHRPTRQAAGVPPDRRTAHALRHTFCTAVAARSNLEIVSRLAGHADVRTSARYVDVTDARVSAAISDSFDRGAFNNSWG
jgi:integrase